jgi:integrase
MARLAILTGLRRGELFGLQWERVDFRSRTLTIPRSKHGKARSVPLGNEAEGILRRLPRRLGSPWVFLQPGEAGEPYQDTPKAWNVAREKAGLGDFRWHDLRHTFGSRLAMAGVDILTIKELMGHKTLAMTLRYAHLSPSHVGRAVDVLSRHATDTATGTNSNGPRHTAEGRA